MSHKLTMYENLRDMLEAHIAKLEAEKMLTKESLQELYQSCASLDYIDNKIEDCKEKKWLEEHPDEGASGRMYDRLSYSSNGGSYRRGRKSSYDSSSYARPRMRMSDYMYSRDSAKQKMVQKLSTLMDDTMSEEDRSAIHECIDRINNS